jgi:hypothetical protein
MLGAMNTIILIISVIAPLLPVVMFPTRFIGRGLGGTLLGAALIVGTMMLIYVLMSTTMGLGTTDDGGKPAKGASSAATDVDMGALEQLLGN